MVKVCHLSTVHQRRDVRIVYKECLSLIKEGYKVFLVIADGKKDEVFNGLNICGTPKYKHRITRMLFSPLQIIIKAMSIKADVYHFHDMELLPVSLILKAMGHKVIYDVHDNLPKQIMGKHYIAAPLRRLLAGIINQIEAKLSPFMSAIVTADKNKELRFSQYHSTVRCLYNYPLISELQYHNSDVRDSKTICYIGGITKIRGIIQLLDSIMNIDVTLILAGAFEPPELYDECKKHVSWTKVDYRGFLGRKDVADVLSKSCIGMGTLLPNENYLDSLPIKMFEYMSAGIPVIISNFPDWKAIIDHYSCGVCVDPLSVSQITEAITLLLNNNELRNQMGQRGREAVLNELNWGSQEQVLAKLYKEILTK